jgi:hypothetical protein
MHSTNYASDPAKLVGAARLLGPSGRGSRAVEAESSEVTAGVAAPRPSTRHLTQVDVARRWRLSERTLERWRWLGKGPRYLKLGGHVAYRLEDIEAYESAQARG